MQYFQLGNLAWFLEFKGIYGENELKEENIIEAIKAKCNFEDLNLVVPMDGIISKGNYSRMS